MFHKIMKAMPESRGPIESTHAAQQPNSPIFTVMKKLWTDSYIKLTPPPGTEAAMEMRSNCFARCSMCAPLSATRCQ